MLDYILQLDQEALIFLNNLGNSRFDNFWLAVSNKFTWIPLYAVLLFLLVKSYDKRNIWLVLALIGLVFFFTDFMVAQVYRPFFHRLRPCHVAGLEAQLRLIKADCGGEYGFFSAHASNSFGLAVMVGNLLYHKFKKLWLFMLAWAFLVAYSRIYLGVHYPLDMICGSLYGCTIATLFYGLSKKLNIVTNEL